MQHCARQPTAMDAADRAARTAATMNPPLGSLGAAFGLRHESHLQVELDEARRALSASHEAVAAAGSAQQEAEAKRQAEAERLKEARPPPPPRGFVCCFGCGFGLRPSSHVCRVCCAPHASHTFNMHAASLCVRYLGEEVTSTRSSLMAQAWRLEAAVRRCTVL